MVNDTIADLLARIKNGLTAKKDVIDAPVTKMTGDILQILKKEELISDFEKEDMVYHIELLYRGSESEITELVRISKPSRRVYVSASEIKPVMNGRGISIVSTSHGVMTGALAKSKKLGGELICEIW